MSAAPRPAAEDDSDARTVRGRWFVTSLSIAPLVAVVYLFSEWLFVITKPSPTSALPLVSQLRVLVTSPTPILVPLLGIQALASLVSLVAYPRLRGFALLPAAVIGGGLLLVLIDNFTYTLLGFGIVHAGPRGRIVYATLLVMLVAMAGSWLHERLRGWCRHPLGTKASLAVSVAVLLCGTPAAVRWVTAPGTPAALSRDPDASVLPPFARTPHGTTDAPNILFLGADGIDAELLSAYGYERDTSPFLTSLRDDTLFFENAFSNTARTHGSLVTLLTGRLPFSTHVVFPPTMLQGEDAYRTLPVLLKHRGYTTLQLGMRHYADAEDTNVQGFDAANYRWQRLDGVGNGQAGSSETSVFRSTVLERIDDRIGHLLGQAPGGDVFAHIEGRAVVPQWRDARRVATLERFFDRAPEPWFVHLHLLDSHCCTWAPERQHFRDGSPDMDARDSQIRETDASIGRLFEALAASGRLERTIVVISSDHASEWKTTQRVPLMVRFPRRQFAGRVTSNVQIADVAPTMLDYLGAEVPSWMEGQSLLQWQSMPDTRRIFGVSNVKQLKGATGAKFISDSGAPNYGASDVMMVAGHQWFELSLSNGQLRSGVVQGHTAPADTLVSESDARQALLEQLHRSGFAIERPSSHWLTTLFAKR